MLCLCYVIKPELPLSLVSVRRKCSLNQTRVSSSDDMFFCLCIYYKHKNERLSAASDSLDDHLKCVKTIITEY